MINQQEIAAVAKAFQKKQRVDLEFHRLIRRMTESQFFNGFIIVTIFINAFFMALETEESLEEKLSNLFNILDNICLGIYTVEFILKIYAEPINYWKSYYNIFDFLILAISWVQSSLTWWQGDSEDSKLKSLRVLRALRTFRTLRTVSFIRGLQVS